MLTPPNVSARDLLDRLHADPGVPALEGILAWLLQAGVVAQGNEVPRTRRLAVLAGVLAEHPARAELVEQIRRAWSGPSSIRMLAETGLPVHATLVKEAVERLVDRFIPSYEPGNDLYVMLTRLPLTEEDAAWIGSLGDAELAPWREVVAVSRARLLEAARLMARRVAAVGLAREVLELEPNQPETASPFFRIGYQVDMLAQAPDDPARFEAWSACYDGCRDVMTRALDQLETRGISTDLIYRLELLETLLERLDDLILVATGRQDGRRLAADLVRGAMKKHSIRALGRTALKRLARKVVEHTGETGEHYLANTRAEWEVIGVAALWGGVIAGLTAATKFAVTSVNFPPMLLGLAVSINYAIGFVLMQLMGFILASRQPSMTAASLADSLEHDDDLEEQVNLVAGLTRSQVIATIGNVLLAIPVGLVLVAVSYLLNDRAPISNDTALYAIQSIHPWRTMTVPFAAVTGVLLWMASLAAGWAANAAAYRGLARAVAIHPRLVAVVGAERAARFGHLIERHLSGVVGYVVLAFLMGFVPVLFSLVGIPLTVPHVSLNSGSFAMGVGTLLGEHDALRWQEVAWGMLGIVLIGTMNIAVSFGLALRTAMRARDLGRAQRARLSRALWKAFRARPGRFLWRPREADRGEVAPAAS